jgi:DNA adenine methylase
MKYMGSKARIAKHILPIILKDRKGETFVDLFVGGCNIADKVSGEVIACDNNKYLIALYQGLQAGIVGVSEISKSLYDKARKQYNGSDNGFTDFEVGWVGYMASANGRFYEGGYSGISQTMIGTQRNYIDESIRGIKKQIEYIGHIKFVCSDYKKIELPKNCIVYADPPYEGAKQYATSSGFNHPEFWQWCRDGKAKGHSIFISEYNAPPDFSCIWQMPVKSSLSANGKAGGNKTSIEKLFTI